MRKMTSRLATMLAIATLAVAPGCDDGPAVVPNPDVTVDTNIPDGGTTDGVITDDGTPKDTSDVNVPPGDTLKGDDGGTPPGDVQEETTDDCAGRECGLSPAGTNCGICTDPEKCNSLGQCNAPANPLGSFCGPNAECPQLIDDPANPGEQILNPDFQNCLNPQCESGFCYGAGGLSYSSAPVCSDACAVSKDDVNNATGNPGGDGVDDPDVVNSACANFEDGPNGSEFRCVSYTPPGQQAVAFCTPGTTFAECKSSNDCAAGEMCGMLRINGVFSERCMGAFKGGDYGVAAKGGEACNEVDPFEDGGLKFCEQGGLCFGFGCASYCDPGADLDDPSDDVGCNTTLWEPDTGCDTGTNTCMGNPNLACTADIDCSWLDCGLIDQTIFSNDPYAADFCFPRGCVTDANCPTDMYCRFNYNGDKDANNLPVWDSFCLPKADGGVALGEACDADPDDNVPGDTCLNEAMCFGGFCSTICDLDADCGTDQLCHVIEFQIEDLTVPAQEQSLPLAVCLNYQGSKTACLSQADCGAGESCSLYTYFNTDVATKDAAPIFRDGLCVTAVGAGATGATCTGPGDCAGGFCMGADAEAGVAGFCSEVCATAESCPQIDDGNGGMANGVCTNLFVGYGGDSRRVDTRIYTGVCQFTTASGAKCGPGESDCPATEACSPFVIGSGPNNPTNTDYLCLGNVNAEDAPAPAVALGGVCNLAAVDSAGDPVEECLSAICLSSDDSDDGYCSKICDPAADTCAADLNIPTAICAPVVTQPRPEAFSANEGKWYACRKDENCAPCAFSQNCPGDRACVNLGTDDDTNSDFRCVPTCTEAADCAGKDGGAECNTGADFFGNESMGCFDQVGAAPTNFCATP